MIIDAFTHAASPAFIAAFSKALGGSAPWVEMPGLHDMEARIAVMDEFAIDKQVITLTGPPIEVAAPDPAKAAALAKLANDGIAEIATRYPDRFIPVGAVALTDMDSALREAERCLTELGMKGILIYSNVLRRPLDAPDFFPFFALMAERGLPIWLHPARGPNYADYAGENTTKYDVAMIFGWAYETTLAMTRLVFSGYFEQLPDLKIILHHAGAFVPLLANRIEGAYCYPPGRTFPYRDVRSGQSAELKRPPLDYYRMFYTDIASHGSLAAVSAAYGFFGARQILFGTDAPFDLAEGREFTRSHREVLDTMLMCEEDRQLVYSGNLKRLIGL